jgi:hypothetical protein
MKTDMYSTPTQAGDGETSSLSRCFRTLLKVPEGYVLKGLQDTEADFGILDAVSVCLFVSFLDLFRDDLERLE